MSQTNTLQLNDERETARMLHVSRATLRAWRARGGGPPWLRVGGKLVRYDLTAVHEWIAEQNNKTQAASAGTATAG